VVHTVTVTFVAELVRVTEAGDAMQVVSEGAPMQVKVTIGLNPSTPTTLKV
jgi:hypothetical protein